MTGTPDPLAQVLDDLARRADDEVAPYEHVRRSLAAAVADGALPVGTRLPTVRGLADRLGLAPGTVARAYRELEADGVVRTEGRKGTFVGDRAPSDAEAAAAAASYAALARRRGLSLAEAQGLVGEHWGPA